MYVAFAFGFVVYPCIVFSVFLPLSQRWHSVIFLSVPFFESLESLLFKHDKLLLL